jgi:hypothetical protein
MNQMVIQSLQKQMDQETRRQDMNSNLEKNQDVDQEVYETSNMSTIFEPKSL